MHVHSYLRDGQLVAVVSERCRATPCSDRFVLPSISDVSIALSSSYVCTFVSLMLVCLVWTLVCQLTQPVFNDDLPQYGAHGWLRVASDVPEIFERAFCFGGLALSIVLLTRLLGPAKPQAEQQRPSLAARLWRALLSPVDWRAACLFVLVVSLFEQAAFVLLIFAPGWGARLAHFTPLFLLLHLIVPLYILRLWQRSVHHPRPAAAAQRPAAAESDAAYKDIESFPPSVAVAKPWWRRLLRRWRSLVAMLLLAFTYLLPAMKYLLHIGIPDYAYSKAMPIALGSSVLWGIVCIAADRDASGQAAA
jgi:hypothetical protein